MFCIKCGKQLPDDAAFCYACGSKVWKEEGAAPVAPEAAPVMDVASDFSTAEAPEVQKPSLTVPMDAEVKIGNFFVESDCIYFLIHGYRRGSRTQLWRSNRQGKECACLLDFDKIGYEPYGDAFTDGGWYYMAKVDSLIFFRVSDEDVNYFQYYYDIATGNHGIFSDFEIPDKISADGKYFCKREQQDIYYEMLDETLESVVITLLTPYEALMGWGGYKISLNKSTLWTLYAECDNVVSFDSEYFVYNDMQILIPVITGSDRKWTRIDLSNLSDYVMLPHGYDVPDSHNFYHAGYKVVFRDYNNPQTVIIDTKNMQALDKFPVLYGNVVQYGEQLYIYGDRKEFTYDFDTRRVQAVAEGSKVLMPEGDDRDVARCAEGIYKYRYDACKTRIYFLPAAEMFRPMNPDYDGDECVPAITVVNYNKEFKPVPRNAATDETVYTYDNTEEMGYFARVYADILYGFFYSSSVALPDGKLIGFKYGHEKEYADCKNHYYNLYEYDVTTGKYRFLGGGSRGGIEHLYIYKNYAYWYDYSPCRCDLLTGEFVETRDAWLEEEYESVKARAQKKQL